MSEPLARAKAINEKYQAEVARQIHAINKAIVLIGALALTGIAFFGVMASQEGHQKKVDLINQEQVTTWKR